MMLLICLLLASAPIDQSPELDLDRRASAQWASENESSLMRVELQTSGGPLPFLIEFSNARGEAPEPRAGQPDGHSYNWFEGQIRNGVESLPVKMYVVDGGYGGSSRCWIDFAQLGCGIEATGTGSCISPSSLPRHFLRRGYWTSTRGGTPISMQVNGYPIEDADDRFDPLHGAVAAAHFTGRWAVDFSSTNDPAVGVFEVSTDQIATGTFLTPTGDYRHLAGRVDGDLMRLSTFDGAHAYLFHARMQADGTITGDFWSGNWRHETWTAVRDETPRP